MVSESAAGVGDFLPREVRALVPLTSKPRMIAEKILFLFMMFPFLAGVL